MTDPINQLPEDQSSLLAALQDLVAQLKRPQVPAEDQLWTAEDIADYLKLATDTTERRVVTRPDFPAPLQPCETGRRAAKRWFAIDVRAWARKNASKLPTGRAGRRAA
ncbi:hypothetical protein [Ectopseudomonas mendocina]|uniref:hypothetical protein n=1 Tax=Ectopseudomonas mendocina TaxID=300 RepID=UPI00376ED309